MIKEQLLLYSPYAEHDYRLNNNTVTQGELEMMLVNEIHNTVMNQRACASNQPQSDGANLRDIYALGYPEAT